jgi:transposase-like protein
MLSAKRDMAAAQRFFQSAKAVTGQTPEQVTTDGHDSYPRAIAEVLGKRVKHGVAAPKIIGSRWCHHKCQILFCPPDAITAVCN